MVKNKPRLRKDKYGVWRCTDKPVSQRITRNEYIKGQCAALFTQAEYNKRYSNQTK